MDQTIRATCEFGLNIDELIMYLEPLVLFLKTIFCFLKNLFEYVFCNFLLSKFLTFHIFYNKKAFSFFNCYSCLWLLYILHHQCCMIPSLRIL